jgi:hypothetical protein
MLHRSRTGAFALIIIGTIFLLINLGLLPAIEIRQLLSKWWPLILILVGVWSLGRPRKSE